MNWYTFAFTRTGINHGEHEKLIQSTRSIWESQNRPADFALFGKHEVQTPEGEVILYYLGPDPQRYCSDGFFTFWQPNQVTHSKPNRVGLEVLVGDADALQLLE